MTSFILRYKDSIRFKCALIVNKHCARGACYPSFTRKNIQAAFFRYVIYPLDPSRLISVSLPRHDDTIASFSELLSMMSQKHCKVRERILGADVEVLNSGSVNTDK